MDKLTLDTLRELLALQGPSGDEGTVAELLMKKAGRISGVQTVRIGDSIVAVKGVANAEKPLVAIFAHTDSTGFTLGYGNKLIPIGGPAPKDKDELRSGELRARIRVGERRGPHGEPDWTLKRVRDAKGKKATALLGSRWVYAYAPKIKKGIVSAPYLDDRAGVWCALNVLARAERVAVAFCTGEEAHGHGARICADYLYRNFNVTQALISDLTWHGDETPCGKGVAVSRRDGTIPRQAYLDRVLTLAKESGVAYQEEVQSAGGSDGGHIQRSAVPMDWVFVGAPEKDPHTSKEQAHLSDLEAMTDLLAYLVERL